MRLAASLLGLGPHDGAHRVAARAGLSVLVPLLVLLATDHLAWSAYAAFGAFTSLYGRTRVGGSRLRMQAALGLLLTALVTLGVLVGTYDGRAWLAVPLAALVAAGASVASDTWQWHPPGALFPVFAFTACASVPSSPADAATAALVAGATAAFAVVVGNAGSWWRRVHGGPAPVVPDLGPAEGRLRTLALPSGLAVLAAGALATGVGIGHPYWAMVSAVVPLAARSRSAQLTRGVHRVVGTGLGLLVAGVVLAFEPAGLVLVLVVVALQVVAELLVGRNYALALVAITPLALLMVHLASPVPARDLLVDRGLETVIGVAVGLAVGQLFSGRAGGSARP
ncbi:FUSC family protein [Nocardioides sp. W7]|uniref:FUSC family protein n=1 Tax=Nocardioides sp. W7 TaxID=2931390 RepID=UPI001FD6299B|nr:FUSC family protein [Nocardioides sp. W7]